MFNKKKTFKPNKIKLKIMRNIFLILNLIQLALCKELAKTAKITQLTGPGMGWDYLKDTSRYPLLDITFDLNKTTDDGKYRIPDCVVR